MKTIKNKTQKPLSVPLPQGKKLFLGPGKSGQIATKAADHPPLVALLEADEIEIVGEGNDPGAHGSEGGSSVNSSQQRDHSPKGTTFRSGDR